MFFFVYTISCKQFIQCSFVGVSSMLRMNPPDILHTVPHGLMEYTLGFVLQCVKLVSSIDNKSFGRGPHILSDNVRFFPNFHSLYPVRHIHFPDLWDIYVSESSKNKGNSTNSTTLLTLNEYFKIPSALFQVMLTCIDTRIFPNNMEWCISFGLSVDPFNPMRIVVNALMSTMKVYWYIHSESLSETQIVTLQMLIANAHAQLQILDLMRKRLLHRSYWTTRSKCPFSDMCIEDIGLLENPKLEMLSHIPDCLRNNGCDTSAFNTALGELEMKVVRPIWNTTSKRKGSETLEILRKYRNLSLLEIIRQGIVNENENWCPRQKDVKKNHRSDVKIAEGRNFDFFCNKGQRINWIESTNSYEAILSESLKVHDFLLEVCIHFLVLYLFVDWETWND